MPLPPHLRRSECPSASPAAVAPDSRPGLSRPPAPSNLSPDRCLARHGRLLPASGCAGTEDIHDEAPLPPAAPPNAARRLRLRPGPAARPRRCVAGQCRRCSRARRGSAAAGQQRPGQGRYGPGQGHCHRASPRGGFAEGTDADHRARRRDSRGPAHLPGAGPAAGAAQRQCRLHPCAAVERRRARHRQQPRQRRPGRQRRDLPRQRLPGTSGNGRVRPAGHRATGAAARSAGHPVRQEHHRRGAEHQHPRADLHCRAYRRGLRRAGWLLPGPRHGFRAARRNPRRTPLGLSHPRRRLHQEHPRRQLSQRRRAPGARGQLLFEPNEDFSLRWIADYNEEDSSNGSMVVYGGAERFGSAPRWSALRRCAIRSAGRSTSTAASTSACTRVAARWRPTGTSPAATA